MSGVTKLVYAITFQIGWFVCIMAGNIASLSYAALFLMAHLWFVARQKTSFSSHEETLNRELTWILLIVAFGFAIETISFYQGFLYFETSQSIQSHENFYEKILLPPLWLLSVWLMFAVALRTCLAFIFQRPVISYLLSVIFVPINYYAGANLNPTVALNQPYFLSLALITLLWLIFLWCIVQIKHHYFEDIFSVN
jgi:hypothetical protein